MTNNTFLGAAFPFLWAAQQIALSLSSVMPPPHPLNPPILTAYESKGHWVFCLMSLSMASVYGFALLQAATVHPIWR